MEVDSVVCGVIQRIYLENFLCHSRLELKLGANINFIAGRNGSGKSAIFTAVQVVLGSRAGITNRGSSLQSFIKTGETRALVEITLKNDGPGAYLPSVYGSSIKVSRTITSTGGGLYKITDSRGKVVSNKKKDLLNILLKLNIQVENPLCILSQDASREFLKTNSDSKRYELFFRATLLEQIKVERNKIAEDLRIARKALADKSESLEEYKKDVENLEKQIKLFQDLHDSKAKLDTLRGELAWAQVKGLENEAVTLKTSYEKEEQKVQQVIEHIGSLRSALSEAERELIEIQEEVQNADTELGVLRAQQKEKEVALRKARQVYQACVVENRDLDGRIALLQNEVSLLANAIEKLRKTDYEDFWKRKSEREQQMLALVQQKDAIISQRRTGDHHLNQLKSALNFAKQEFERLKEDGREIDRKLSDKSRRLNELKGTVSNHLSVFGAFVPRLSEQFKTAGFRKLPKGPIGSYVKLHNQADGSLVENRLGNLLCGYVVDNADDAAILKRLLSNVNPRPTVIINELGRQRYDVERGTVPAHHGYDRLIDLVSVEDDDIFNVLVDNCSLETQIVVDSERKARDFTSDERNVPPNCSIAIVRGEGHTYMPAPNYRTYAGHLRPCRYFQVSVDDLVSNFVMEIDALKKNKEETRRRLKEADLQVESQTEEVNEETKNMVATRKQLDYVENKIEVLKNSDEPEPEDIRVYEEDIARNQTNIEQHKKQKEEVQERIKQSKSEMDAAEEEYRKISKKVDFIGGENSAQNRLEEAQSKVREISNKTTQYEDRKRKMVDACNKKKQEWMSMARAAQDDAAIAVKICPRLEDTRTLDAVEAEMKSLEAYINKRQSMQGDENEIRKRYIKKRDDYVEMYKKLENFKENVKQLDETVRKRKAWFYKMRDHVTLAVQHWFTKIMRQRNFNGVLDIDHEARTLQIRVNPHGSLQESGNEDMQALSGGERSFTTVAFLLSLWDEAETPFRMMDEFDVFMDAANRAVVLDMLLTKAKLMPTMQFVFLTPQTLTVVPDKQIVIHRLQDPRSTD